MVPWKILLLMLIATVIKVNGIMVPTGKLGPITPPKPVAFLLNRSAMAAPAPVWETVDESGSPYKPPIYNYILYDYVSKYGHHTLIARDEDYYNPTPNVKTGKPTYYYGNKDKYHYSPLQFL